ncbi:DsrE/DsrF/DrsH-like family protein [Haloimpatiens lingqiaonensis]|uniref:DsrE/DsrF/DrsH-like family protein n=1 Tax=Haloimpatiens lingqiaonensis TaxID=1380675 RepID=UPI0010FE7458|nr:DsrE/DsrF/DrsH-like family protein [Haloimpatiens lingqiaonensis]
MSKKVLIVGGVAGGASTAARLRRLDETAEIIMFEKGEHISFANCGLPYYIGEVIKDRSNLLVQTPEAMHNRFNIDVRINSEVSNINFENKTVKVNSKDKGEYQESFDYLVLAPGAKPMKPPIPGIDSSKIFTLRNVNDTDKIKSFVDNSGCTNAVVIGGGYIGVEMAENLRHRNINVTLVEAAPHILAPFDSDMVTIAEKELEDNGVNLILGDGVKAFNENVTSITVVLNSGTEIEADIVISAIGVTPDTAFLKDTPMEMGPKGHIIVNENLQTNIENVYALGDAVEVVDFINGSKTAIPLAGPANKQGRIVADNISGIKSSYKGTQGTSIIKVFDLTCAGTGNNERILNSKNIKYKVIYALPQSHASYYPGASPITIKLIFNDEGKVLGAQAIGYEGVDKRIDDIASLIRLNGTIEDLTQLELAYAPPYSSAKDPVNIAAYIAENVLTGKSEVVLPRDIDNFNKETTLILDVRNSIERENGYIKDSMHIPVDELRNRLEELPKDKEIWVFCQIGLRGYIAERMLKANGFKAKNITGGYKVYSLGKFKPSKINKEEKSLSKEETSSDIVTNVDACGLCCPGPLMKVKESIDAIREGSTLKVTASDPGFYEDIKAWCKRTDNNLLNLEKSKGIITATIKKNGEKISLNNSEAAADKCEKVSPKDNKTMVVFSGDLDKAIASFIIANGAASMGKKVTMFFTFWGINILRKDEKVTVNKNFIEKMFGKMMPRGSKRLKLSNMNMAGMGPKMIRNIMKKHNVSSLEELIKSAIKNGVEIVACQMSMELLGLRKEELIDGVKIGGVGYYLGEAEDSNVNLFI